MMRPVYLFLFLLMVAPGIRAQEPCRIDESSLTPIVDRFNPFFTDHSWDNDEKVETARMDPNRLLIIRQKACTRHHVLLSLVIDPSVVEQGEKFWVTEVFVMFKRVYFNTTDYLAYKKKFEKEFIAYFQENGLNHSFTFPVDDRTFICKIEQGEWGGKIVVEMVRYVLGSKVKMPGIPREKDDGWRTSPED